jgi:hypothetical protein
VVSSELNHMLVRYYDFNVKRHCKSLRDLEKILEIIAFEISDEYKKTNKRSKVSLWSKCNTPLLKSKPKEINFKFTNRLCSAWKPKVNCHDQMIECRSWKRQRIKGKSCSIIRSNYLLLKSKVFNLFNLKWFWPCSLEKQHGRGRVDRQRRVL